MNAYVYAPKDDPRHRAAWREPYDEARMSEFRALIEHAHRCGLRFGFAISPGLDIDYGSGDDRTALLAKLGPFVDAGVSWFLLALDDIPSAPGLASRQADIASWLLERLHMECDDAHMVLCPTEYVGTHGSAYLTDLGRLLPRAIDVMWTGTTVCSPTLTAEDAASWAAALGGRPPLVWDNYPVNDGAMEQSLHLGPYRGRDPGLADTTIGVLCNPMRLAQSSKVALATAADFLLDPDSYDPERSWRRAIDAVGGERRGPLRVLAEACADGPLCEPGDLDLARRVADIRTEIATPGWTETVRNTAEMLRATKRVPDDFAGDDALSLEVAPWAKAAAAEADLGLAALRLLQQLRPVARIEGGEGRVAGVDAQRAMHTAFLLLALWTGPAARSGSCSARGSRSTPTWCNCPTAGPPSTSPERCAKTATRSTPCAG